MMKKNNMSTNGIETIRDFFNEYDKETTYCILKFIKSKRRTFNKYIKDMVRVPGERFIYQHAKEIGCNIKIVCDICNCENINNFDSFLPVINLMITDRKNDKNVIRIFGSEDSHGCTIDEYDEFINIVEIILKEKTKNKGVIFDAK